MKRYRIVCKEGQYWVEKKFLFFWFKWYVKLVDIQLLENYYHTNTFNRCWFAFNSEEKALNCLIKHSSRYPQVSKIDETFTIERWRIDGYSNSPEEVYIIKKNGWYLSDYSKKGRRKFKMFWNFEQANNHIQEILKDKSKKVVRYENI